MPEPGPAVPESKVVDRSRTRISLVWFIPIVAALVGAWVAVTRILSEGPTITIVLKSAEGLEAGKTKIHYNGVDVGTISAIRLSDDHQNVIANAQMAPKTEDFLVEDTQFWVVRPRISGATVSGLGTLISGAYIGMDIGISKQRKRDFIALNTPPVVTGGTPGRFFELRTPTLGSLDYGTPIFFRRLQVGEVSSYELDDDGEALHVKVFIKAPYDQYVTLNTRFWQASGIDVSLNASGLTVQTQSLLSILIGGIAFETPPASTDMPAADADTVFTLFSGRTDAFKLPALDPQTYLLVFTDSVRGLAPGAPVEFRGIPLGEVADVTAQFDAKTLQLTVLVTIRLDIQRLGTRLVESEPGADMQAIRRQVVEGLVARGVRAQLRTGSLITGALYVAFDVYPDAPPATVDWSQKPVQLPTIPGELAAIEANLVSIIKKIDQIPFKGIGDDLQTILKKLDQVPYKSLGEDLQKVLAELDQTLATTRGTLGNANKLIEPNSVLSMELGNTLQEVSRAARELRNLADYLERHPEALLRGKPGSAK